MRTQALRGQVTPGHTLILLVEGRRPSSLLLTGSVQTSSPVNPSVQAVDGSSHDTEGMKTVSVPFPGRQLGWVPAKLTFMCCP